MYLLKALYTLHDELAERKAFEKNKAQQEKRAKKMDVGLHEFLTRCYFTSRLEKWSNW